MFTNKEFERQVLDELSNIKSKIDSCITREEFVTHAKSLEMVESKLVTVSKDQRKYIDEVHDKLQQTLEVAHEFSLLTKKFDSMRNSLQTILESRFHTMIEDHTRSIKQKVNTFSDASEQLQNIVDGMQSVSDEFKKFELVAKSIKEVDFTLHKHSQDLIFAQKKIDRLTRENDHMKDLVAKMRRRQ